jgi:hypothetical protein
VPRALDVPEACEPHEGNLDPVSRHERRWVVGTNRDTALGWTRVLSHRSRSSDPLLGDGWAMPRTGNGVDSGSKQTACGSRSDRPVA